MGVKRIKNNELFVCIGKVLRPVGVEGAIKIQNYSDVADRFDNLEDIFIGPTTDLAIPYAVESVEYRGNNIVLQLIDHESIEAVKHLQGLFCYMPKSAQEPLGEDEYYVDDLLGLDIQNTDNKIIGVVKDIIQSPANDVLVIDNGGNEVLLPMVGEFIQKVDIAAGVIIINPVEGIIDSAHAH